MAFQPPSAFRSPADFPVRLPQAPAPASATQRISHALPLPLHVAASAASVAAAAATAAVAHAIDGPLRPGWSFMTSVVHASLKAIMHVNPPQGRHSLGIVRFATQFSLPSALMGARCDADALVSIREPGVLAAVVRRALRLCVHKQDLGEISEKESVCENSDCAASLTNTVDYSLVGNVRSVRGEWIRSASLPSRDPDEHVVLYLHGGGEFGFLRAPLPHHKSKLTASSAHFFLSPRSHRFITTKISEACAASVFVPDYRLAPEIPFPSAVEDALACYIALAGIPSDPLDGSCAKFNSDFVSVAPSRIFVMGDSSGGCLALQLVQTLKALGLPLPAGLVLISPFLDHELKSPSFHRNWESDFMTLDLTGMDWAMQVYANGLPRAHPAVSPLYSNLADMPPIMIQSGDSEVVTDDATRFQELAIAAGSRVDVELYANMFHVFHKCLRFAFMDERLLTLLAAFPFLPESAEAFRRIGQYVNGLLSLKQDAAPPAFAEADSGISLGSSSDASDTASNTDSNIGSRSGDFSSSSARQSPIRCSSEQNDPIETSSWGTSAGTPKLIRILRSRSGTFSESRIPFDPLQPIL